MINRVVWDLSEKDFIEIEDLFERKLALENLSKIIDSNNKELYEKFVSW